ncbi:tyrosine-type recombinase/integrase [Nocardia carnea]|uniref:tyrosine-type recombinase/integrase n=1 Tax=Nocardia carnea TaxID=37328 RepID=UPI0003059698|nr:site-specific integrase [Nocardia carnea]
MTITAKDVQAGGERTRIKLRRYDDLADTVVAGGGRDLLPVDAVVDLVRALPMQGNDAYRIGTRIRTSRAILDWLASHPGDGWQGRWISSGADHDSDWLDQLGDPGDSRSPKTRREAQRSGLSALLACRIFFPSYRFLSTFRSPGMLVWIRATTQPALFNALDARGHELGIGADRRRTAICHITKIVTHTGRDVDQLTGEDLLGFRAWHLRENDSIDGLTVAWTLLRGIADLGEAATLAEALRIGQRPTRELVDSYGVRSTNVREVLVRYLDERRPAMDYNSLCNMTSTLVKLFWCDIERHHPGIDSLDLPDEIADGWKQRMRTVPLKSGRPRSDNSYFGALNTVRCFYLDLQEWARQDPSWAQWAFPSPVRRRDTAGYGKSVQRTSAAMHQRVRERLPHLPLLVDTAERHKTDQEALLAATKAAPVGAVFEHAGKRYRRVVPKSRLTGVYREVPLPNRATDMTSGLVIDVDKTEHDAFWAWAVIETLRHTGIRLEELMELTHLGLVSYQLPATGEIVPMLQIVPSKGNEERLLLVSPELADVLAAIISRLRARNGGVVPLTARYDPHEKITSPPLPYLFQHRQGFQWKVPGNKVFQNWLTAALERTGLTDATGQPLHCTPHDFRRMFATGAVQGGLPIHILARILGHKSISTTQAYAAVFDEDLVNSYRAFLRSRRAVRPEAEYREPTEHEWQEFQQHFELRKLELGTCGRPYNVPCSHEHACIRCPSLRVDLRSRNRLADIIGNLRDRITEAQSYGWTGEVEGLRVSLNAAAAKLASLDRMRDRTGRTASLTDLGMPIITEGQRIGR